MSKSSNNITARVDVYTRVTDRIINDLEAGTRPWMKPWAGPGGDGLVLDEIEPISDPESVSEMRRFIDEVTEATQLGYYGEVSLPVRHYTTAEWTENSETKNYPQTIDDELIIQAQLRFERIPDRLPLLANFGGCLQGELSQKFVEFLFGRSERYDFITPPLEFMKNGKIGFSGSAAFGNNVLRSVTISAGLFEFACGNGKISLDELPSEVQATDRMLSFLHQTLHHMIVETDND
jgi:hypothetical protein